MIQTSAPLQSHGRESYASSQAINAQTNVYACDDPSIVAQYLHNFPPLQPTRVLGVQPSTSGEEMLYPGSSSRSQYLHDLEGLDTTGLGIQGPSQMTDPLNTETAMAAAITGDGNSPPLPNQATFGGMSVGYDVLHAYADPDSLVSAGSHALEHASSEFGGVYNPHHRTPSARRGPFKDHDQREKTAHTRRIGSCIRCRMQRIRVS